MVKGTEGEKEKERPKRKGREKKKKRTKEWNERRKEMAEGTARKRTGKSKRKEGRRSERNIGGFEPERVRTYQAGPCRSSPGPRSWRSRSVRGASRWGRLGCARSTAAAAPPSAAPGATRSLPHTAWCCPASASNSANKWAQPWAHRPVGPGVVHALTRDGTGILENPATVLHSV